MDLTSKDLRKLRQRIGLSQTEFGHSLGVSPQRISQLERMEDTRLLPTEISDRLSTAMNDKTGVLIPFNPNEPVSKTFLRARWQPNGTKTFLVTTGSILEATSDQLASVLADAIRYQPESTWHYVFPDTPNCRQIIESAYSSVVRKLLHTGISEDTATSQINLVPAKDSDGIWFHPIAKTILTIYPTRITDERRTRPFNDAAFVEIPLTANGEESSVFHCSSTETTALVGWLEKLMPRELVAPLEIKV